MATDVAEMEKKLAELKNAYPEIIACMFVYADGGVSLFCDQEPTRIEPPEGRAFPLMSCFPPFLRC